MIQTIQPLIALIHTLAGVGACDPISAEPFFTLADISTFFVVEHALRVSIAVIHFITAELLREEIQSLCSYSSIEKNHVLWTIIID